MQSPFPPGWLTTDHQRLTCYLQQQRGKPVFLCRDNSKYHIWTTQLSASLESSSRCMPEQESEKEENFRQQLLYLKSNHVGKHHCLLTVTSHMFLKHITVCTGPSHSRNSSKTGRPLMREREDYINYACSNADHSRTQPVEL